MKKRLVFVYRYLTASRHFRLWRARWITAQTLMVVGIVAAFWGTMALSGPYAPPANPAGGGLAERASNVDLSSAAAMQSGSVVNALLQQQAGTPDPNLPPTRTPLPPEYLSNSNQTVGITLASVVLVLIVVGGVLLLMPLREENGGV